jgi:hypothetical protein
VLEQTVQIVTLAGVLFTAAGIFLAIYVYRRQMNAQLFLEYTRRYEEVMRSFPEDARACRLHLEGEPPPQSEALTSAVLRYLNLCSEEFYLCRRKYLSNDIWQIWQAELERTLRSPLVRREWQDLSREFDSYGEFSGYVRKVQQTGSEAVAQLGSSPLGG